MVCKVGPRPLERYALLVTFLSVLHHKCMRRYKGQRELITSAVAIQVLATLSRFNMAAEYHRRARCSEAEGYPYTSAMQWRKAAELFATEDWIAEKCWQKWERIMCLPRKFSQAIA